MYLVSFLENVSYPKKNQPKNMKNVIITGATGMIGGIALQQCLDRNDVAKVTSISRKSVGIQHEKLVEIIHDDFSDYSQIEHHFKNQDVCIFCIGVYTGAVSNDLFKKITVDYTEAFANVLRKYNNALTFCFLSGQGADQKEKSRIFFAKQKGIAENILKRLNFKNLHIFRPGYIYPVTPRQEPNFSYKIMRAMYKPVAAIYPNIGLTSVQLATKMVNVGMEGGEMEVFENRDIKR